ncbi:MAG: hypothetical protein Q9217_002735 [Psora testacea]
MFSPRRRSITTVTTCLALLALVNWLFLTSHGQNVIRSFQKKGPVSHFHLLVPASRSNQHLCRLLLSSIVLNYPPPILINWDAVETDNVFLLHLGKINKVLAYLERFSEEQDDDLMLMVDGYDVWFQLPPEVLIRRYFDVIVAQNDRIRATYGAEIAEENDFQQTILFGSDKLCWPDEEGGRPACWAVPQSTLPKYAFGPYDDVEYTSAKKVPYQARPRWLNSGTIMGPVKDVRSLFESVAAQVRDHYQGDSDQYYFAKLWGFQEYARLQLEPNGTIPTDVKEPELGKEVGNSHKIELHVSLDYNSAIFQTIGYYDPYLTWLRFDGSIQAGRPKDSPIPKRDAFGLAEDVKAARPPLAALAPLEPRKKEHLDDINKALFKHAENIRLKQWPEMPLLTNIITKHVPPLLHFMMEKDYRTRWWDRMWYTPFAKDLFRASITAMNVPIFKEPLNGRMWANADNQRGTAFHRIYPLLSVLSFATFVLHLWSKGSIDVNRAGNTSQDFDAQIRNETLGFQKVFVVNLPERGDRLDAFVLSSSLTGFQAEVSPGINGSEVPDAALPSTAGLTTNHLSSALILEDDSDWDVSLKDRLVDFAHGSRHFATQSSGGVLPQTPYGDVWDMLWLGHCSITQYAASNSHTTSDHSTGSQRQQRFLIDNDPTVPPASRRWNVADTPDLSSYTNMTRAVFRADYGICLYAYALSYTGAQKILRAQAIRKTWAPIDLGLGDMCKDSANTFNCIGVFPQLVDCHKTAGPMDRDSNIGNFPHDIVREVAYSPNIIYSTRLNVDRLLNGEEPLSQWHDLSDVVAEPGGVRHRIVDLEVGKAPNTIPENTDFAKLDTPTPPPRESS